jgi:4-hydroxy-tetrahydrodipicolinate reductase
MGRAVARLAAAADDVTIVGAVDGAGNSSIGRDVGELGGIGTLGVALSEDLAAGLLGADVVIDFSSPRAVPVLARAARKARVAVVSGTTGLDADALRALDEAAEHVPVLWAPNMSVGVHVLKALVARAVAALGTDWSVEIVETHHGAKVDAPSGTALDIASAIRGVRAESRLVHGRQGRVGPRASDEIGMHAVRGGGVIGDHTVHLLTELERLEISHRAMDRDVFAVGALRAAQFVAGKPPRRYTMADVVG